MMFWAAFYGLWSLSQLLLLKFGLRAIAHFASRCLIVSFHVILSCSSRCFCELLNSKTLLSAHPAFVVHAAGHIFFYLRLCLLGCLVKTSAFCKMRISTYKSKVGFFFRKRVVQMKICLKRYRKEKIMKTSCIPKTT